MAGDQFGFQMGELAKIQQDWQQLNQQMASMTAKMGEIESVIAKAAATDLFAGIPSGLLGFGVIANRLTKDVAQIKARAEALKQTKEKLTQELGEDAEKLKAVSAEYAETEKKILEELAKQKDKQPPSTPQPPQQGGGGTGSGSGGSGGGSGGGGGGGSQGGHGGHGGGHGGTGLDGGGSGDSGGSGGGDGGAIPAGPGGKYDGPKLKDHSTGNWNDTRFITGHSWDAWSDHAHPTNGHGEGVVDRPNLDGLDPERKAILERGLDRAEHKLGYSQGAVTNGYRVDCSGLVSAAWGIPPGSEGGLNTWDLESSNVSHHITKDELKPGDALVCNTPKHEHVVLFGGWANPEHTKFICIEDSGSKGCVSHVLTYPYPGTGPYRPIRKNGVE
ncbi:hypothetical protein CFP65_4087 [Kitasatospora sp. MMS16-BH015]|uniref:hypothetical protein n=1 Tax=Kitasatospora sp. MMS16-BH015 TaxID=2018025 RepID=UPI000CA24E68|nr:hypothetical protein [Kitasatospora sp. MMS16-BH015]AUG78849.1 hypothetical protein CFP65_4087 [Kitasatospora sp. MMS16-BH015]